MSNYLKPLCTLLKTEVIHTKRVLIVPIFSMSKVYKNIKFFILKKINLSSTSKKSTGHSVHNYCHAYTYIPMVN